MVAPDPEVVIGEGRSLLPVADLLELADLVSRLVEEQRRAGSKGKYAATVKPNVPHDGAGLHRTGSAGAQGDAQGSAAVLDSRDFSGVIK
jgi:hypothetical protein